METSSLIALTLLVIVVVCVYFYLHHFYRYWKDRGIPYVRATVIYKNLIQIILGRSTFYEMQFATYNSLSGHKYAGCYDFLKPTLFVRDPELIERILIKDFNHFMDRGTPPISEDDILTLNLANAEGERWRALRYKLTPTFTLGKLRGMFEQIGRCCDDLIRYIDEENANDEGQLDGTPLMNRFTMNVIATCAFGIEFAYNDKERELFLQMVKRLMAPSFKQTIKYFAQLYCPGVSKLLGIKVFDVEAAEYFIGLVKEAFRYRTENNTRRNDFLQLLLDLKRAEENGTSVQKEDTADCEPEDAVFNQMHHLSGHNQKQAEKNNLFSFESITAQAVVFLTAGAEASSSLMNFFLFSVATHPDILRKVKTEIDQILNKHGKWNYQAMKDMTYMDQVIQETMRMYPAIIILLRKCTKPYQLPDRDVVIQPGTPVIIPLYSLNFDPQYYPDPQKFDPDRFLDTNYKTSSRFLPFGDGPRICIAMRFALLEMKICLAHVISEYDITLGSKTQMPLQFEPRTFSKLPKGGLWFKFDKRKTQSY